VSSCPTGRDDLSCCGAGGHVILSNRKTYLLVNRKICILAHVVLGNKKTYFLIYRRACLLDMGAQAPQDILRYSDRGLTQGANVGTWLGK